MAYSCQDLFDSSIKFLSTINSKLSVVVDKANKVSAKLEKYSQGLDLGELMLKFKLPDVHLLTMEEYLDLILGCPIAVCVLPNAQMFIDWVETYIANNGPFDPANPPAAVLAMATTYVQLANTKAKEAQAQAAQVVSGAIAKSPLGLIARMKEAFDTLVKNSGIYTLIQATDNTLYCLIAKYPASQNDPAVIRYNSLKSQVSFDAQGNVQTMKNEDQAVMNTCTGMRQDLSSMASRLY
jgi:hypothetical protein